MSRILITGSADGLGLMAAQLLISQGHEVVLHARNQARVAGARAAAPGTGLGPDENGRARRAR
jgi:NAD(P)-dependent dehydrogenase (short-subunit alcohol dehydrogenase family)